VSGRGGQPAAVDLGDRRGDRQAVAVGAAGPPAPPAQIRHWRRQAPAVVGDLGPDQAPAPGHVYLDAPAAVLDGVGQQVADRLRQPSPVPPDVDGRPR
jgi:hypothetical protein